MKRCFLFITSIIILYTSNAYCNNTVKPGGYLANFFDNWMSMQQHIEFGSGLYQSYHYDGKTSPLLFKGPEGSLQGSYFLKGNAFCSSFNTIFGIGLLNNRIETLDEDILTNITVDINGTFNRKMWEWKGIAFYPGAKLQYLTNQWFKNFYSNVNFQYLSAINAGLDVYFERPVFFNPAVKEINGITYKKQPRLILTGSFAVPMLGAFIHPTYHGFADIADPNADIISTDSTAYISLIGTNMLVVETRIGADFQLKNGNAIRLNYWWKFYHYKPEFYTYQHAVHGFSFSLLFSLDNNHKNLVPVKNE